MTIIGLKQKLDMEEVIKYPLNPTPPSLTTTNGYMLKTSKSAIASTLDEYAKDPKANIRNDCVILDAMDMHPSQYFPYP